VSRFRSVCPRHLTRQELPSVALHGWAATPLRSHAARYAGISGRACGSPGRYLHSDFSL